MQCAAVLNCAMQRGCDLLIHSRGENIHIFVSQAFNAEMLPRTYAGLLLRSRGEGEEEERSNGTAIPRMILH